MGLFGDTPIDTLEADRLGRRGACRGLARLLAQDGLDMPLVAAIFGSWGSGKTSFLNLLAREIAAIAPAHLRLRFEAWPFAEDKDALWRALFLCVVEGLRVDASGDQELLDDQVKREALERRFDVLEWRLYRSLTLKEREGRSLNWASTVALGGQAGLWLAAQCVPGFDLAQKTLEKIQERLVGDDAKDLVNLVKTNEVELFREQITSLEQFRNELRGLVEERVKARGRRMFVLIDDLDRCQPEAAVKAVEALKVFLDLPETVFVIAVDRALIEHGVAVRYRALIADPGTPGVTGGTATSPGRREGFRPQDFLDKIIQLPFTLPPPTDTALDAYTADSWPGRSSLPDACRRILRAGIEANPRSLRRALNHLALVARLLEAATDRPTDADDLARLAKLTVVHLRWPEHYAKAVQDPDWLLNVQGGRAEFPDPVLTNVFHDAAGRLTRGTLDELLCLASVR